MLEGAFPANTDAVIVDIQPGTQKRYSGGGTTYATLAAAGIWSTPSDMLKFASSVRGAYLGQKTDWISQAIAQEMFTNNTLSIEPPNVGIGFFINMDDNGEILGFDHGGADAGFMSQLCVELDTGNGYAIMTNGNNVRLLISELEIRLKEALT